MGEVGEVGEGQMQDSHRDRTFFDTSKLMARLNKSASLVRNIKKFL